jgi:exosortase K
MTIAARPVVSRPDAAGSARLVNVACIGLALGLGFGFERFASHATFEELRFVMAPTRAVVEALSRVSFEVEAGRGYVSRERLFEIAPACAGANFMIIAFCSLVCGLVATRRSIVGRLGLLVGAGIAAWVATIVANAIRITIALRLHESGASFGWLTPERLHTTTGVAVYLVALGSLFAAGARLTGAGRELAI